MSFSTKQALRLALVAACAVSVTACASKPKPTPSTPTAPPSYPTQPSVPPGPNGPVPGSVQDFVVNVGDRVYFDFDQFDIRYAAPEHREATDHDIHFRLVSSNGALFTGCWPMVPAATWMFCSRIAFTMSPEVRPRAAALPGSIQTRIA